MVRKNTFLGKLHYISLFQKVLMRLNFDIYLIDSRFKIRGDRKPLESYAISRAGPNTKVPSKVMPIILEKITFGYILGASFFGCNLLLAETYCYN